MNTKSNTEVVCSCNKLASLELVVDHVSTWYCSMASAFWKEYLLCRLAAIGLTRGCVSVRRSEFESKSDRVILIEKSVDTCGGQERSLSRITGRLPETKDVQYFDTRELCRHDNDVCELLIESLPVGLLPSVLLMKSDDNPEGEKKLPGSDSLAAHNLLGFNLDKSRRTPETSSPDSGGGAGEEQKIQSDNKLPSLIRFQEVRAVEIKLDSLPGSEAQVLRDKFQNVFGKNSGYKKMCKVAQVLEGVPVGKIDGVCVCDIPLFKYARLTSCDAERSFSQYKSLFRDNRHAFVMENLEMAFVVHCNSRPITSTQVWLVST
ncbi:hypothetical protein ANN_03801 [Periplaneta americana]|uniref:Uncharacterized protein n=1 Tax=Periplaneta americana TaxID=6978 RepID=A0ABQ8U387_PERAM|nr:hypothetical protein ANN_03801 [Periplaneta americana]